VTGTIVGALENQAWGSALESLSPGEAVVMFTDGVPDARRPGGPLFGEERLAELLAELAGEPVDRLCQRVVARLDEYAASDWPDDVTLLVLRRIA
jgi:sigma-B regulation protein RsbU (phosphoserine phosphatase)